MIGVLYLLAAVFCVAAGVGGGVLIDASGRNGIAATATAFAGEEAFLLALIGLTLVTIGAGVLRRMDAIVRATMEASATGTAATSRSAPGS